MGLFDSIAGKVVGKLSGDKSQGVMVQVAIKLFHDYGGLSGILDKCKENGLSEQVASWVGNGENLPISAKQMRKVIGSATLSELAAKYDISADEISSRFAEYLPGVVDKLTPDGKVPKNQSGLLLQALSMLKK